MQILNLDINGDCWSVQVVLSLWPLISFIDPGLRQAKEIHNCVCVGENTIFESGLGVAQLQLHCKVKTIDIIGLAQTQGHIIVI